ncbi:hypothetical protein ACPV5Q_10420 [Vibrio astriarenae]
MMANARVNVHEHVNAQRLILIVLSCLFYFPFGGVAAETAEQLLQTDNLRIKAWLGKDASTPTDTFMVNQQATLYIEVGTTRWFTAGTRLGHLDIPNAIVKQRSSTATNYTEQINGETWSMQLWEVQIYPQVEGDYMVPSIPVQVSVSVGSRQSVTDKILTQPTSFVAEMPKPIPDQAWFVGEQLAYSQNLQDITREQYKVGDSVTREVKISANNTLSILIPNLLSEQIDGVRLYNSPATRSDKYERGEYTSNYSQKQTAILQTGGEVTFPDIVFQFWNTKTNHLETIKIERQTLTVTHTPLSFLKAYRAELTQLIVAAIMLLCVYSLVKRRWINGIESQRWKFEKRLFKGEFKQARLLLYRREKSRSGDNTISDKLDADINQAIQTDREEVKAYRRAWKVLRKPWCWYQLPRALPQLADRKREADIDLKSE